jgi:valyl-tRNA synthetase
MAKLDGARNFTNKLWNAARFVLGSQPPPAPDGSRVPAPESLAERWIRSRLAVTTTEAVRHLDRYDLGGNAALVTDFVWNDYCDWYLEMAKIELRDPDASAGTKARVWTTGAEVLADILRLLHPVIPFVTEEIWGALGSAYPAATASPLLLTAPWPAPARRDRRAEAAFDSLSEVVRAARNLRTEAAIPAGAVVPLRLLPLDVAAAEAAEAGRRYIEPLARVRLETLASDAQPAGTDRAATALGAIWLEGATTGDDRSASRTAELRHSQARLEALLGDPNFVARAPAAVVARERQRLAQVEERLRQIGESSGSG